jgi:hypothetical protein
VAELLLPPLILLEDVSPAVPPTALPALPALPPGVDASDDDAPGLGPTPAPRSRLFSIAVIRSFRLATSCLSCAISLLVPGDMPGLLPETDALGDEPLVEPALATLPVLDVSLLLEGPGVPGALAEAGGGMVEGLAPELMPLAEALGGGVAEASEGGALLEAPALVGVLASFDTVVVVVVVVVVDEF